MMALPVPLRLTRSEAPDDHVRIVSVKEAAGLLGLSDWSVYRALMAGRLPGIQWSPEHGMGRGQWRMGRIGHRWASSDELKRLFGD
jgi:hypothetical protein